MTEPNIPPMSADEQNPPEDSTPPSPTPADAPPPVPFEQYTLAQAVGQFLRAPRQTARALYAVLMDDADNTPPPDQTPPSSPPPDTAPAQPLTERLRHWVGDVNIVQLGLYLSAFLLVLWGTTIMVSVSAPRRVLEIQFVQALPFVLTGIFLWLTADIIAHAPQLRAWWHTIRQRPHPQQIPSQNTPQIDTPQPDSTRQLAWYMRIHPLRVFGALVAAFLSLLVWIGTSGNTFSTLVFYLWLTSIALWALVLAPLDFNPLYWANQQRLKLAQTRPLVWLHDNRLPILIFIIFFMLAASFRLANLNGDPALGTVTPPEMTSDHVEKILDSNRVLEGSRNIFFANNGGREPIQMYLMAMFSTLPNQSMGFESLKLLAVIESLLTLPFLFLFGREIIGKDDRKLGILVGLLLVGFVAVSYWHVTITRQALRIVLTPLVASLLLIYLARALRSNDRADFIKTGIILGFGLYTYQAVRMLPVVIVVAVLFALIFVARRWRDRWRYVVNLSVLVAMSFIIFLPLFHYSIENPEQFWRRTTGRLLGDDIIEVILDDGTIIEREASLNERLQAFNENVPVLLDNIRNVLLMFNWKGDVGWINGYSNHPVLDPLTGALFILGIIAWLSYAVRRRDVVYWLMPIALFIMLMPSALSIAFPIENPSNTRTSGALPIVYLMAAFALALIIRRFLAAMPGQGGRIAVVAFSSFVFLGANTSNTSIYFNQFRDLYVASSLPYSDAGRVLQGFAISDGAYGNAFMIAYPFWWDHRAIAIESGRPDWNNGIVTLADVPTFMSEAYTRQGDLRFDPQRDIIFFYNQNDTATQQQLRQWFPTGRELRYPTYHTGDEFMLYRVPALGETTFLAFLADNLP